ncbi:MAG: hypothetical protein ABRQ39_29295 [Candidatus Eremiobacterota bacterium]
MNQKNEVDNLLSAYTYQIENASERWFDTFNHEVFHRLDYLQGQKIISKHNLLRIDKKQLEKFPGLSKETKNKLSFLLDRDIPYKTQSELKKYLTDMGIDGREANIIMDKFKLKTSCFSEKAPDTPFYKPATHDISNYARDCQSASETAAETFKSLMKEWRNYDNPGDIQGFLAQLGKKCKYDDTRWNQYAFIVNNYLEKDLPELRYIGDSRSHENILNNIIEVNKKILKLPEEGERKVTQAVSDSGERKVTQSRTSQGEYTEEGSEKISDFETEDSKSPVSTNREQFNPGDNYDQPLPDEPSDTGTVEPSDIAEGGKKGLTPKEVYELRKKWNIDRKK